MMNIYANFYLFKEKEASHFGRRISWRDPPEKSLVHRDRNSSKDDRSRSGCDSTQLISRSSHSTKKLPSYVQNSSHLDGKEGSISSKRHDKDNPPLVTHLKSLNRKNKKNDALSSSNSNGITSLKSDNSLTGNRSDSVSSKLDISSIDLTSTESSSTSSPTDSSIPSSNNEDNSDEITPVINIIDSDDDNPPSQSENSSASSTGHVSIKSSSLKHSDVSSANLSAQSKPQLPVERESAFFKSVPPNLPKISYMEGSDRDGDEIRSEKDTSNKNERKRFLIKEKDSLHSHKTPKQRKLAANFSIPQQKRKTAFSSKDATISANESGDKNDSRDNMNKNDSNSNVLSDEKERPLSIGDDSKNNRTDPSLSSGSIYVHGITDGAEVTMIISPKRGDNSDKIKDKSLNDDDITLLSSSSTDTDDGLFILNDINKNNFSENNETKSKGFGSRKLSSATTAISDSNTNQSERIGNRNLVTTVEKSDPAKKNKSYNKVIEYDVTRSIVQYGDLESTIPKNVRRFQSSRIIELDSAIIHLYEKHKPTLESFNRKASTLQRLRQIFRGVFTPMSDLLPVGSSQANFCTATSDLDMCLVIDPFTSTDTEIPKRMVENVLKDARRIMCQRYGKNTFGYVEFIPARVPILHFKDRITEIECDINVNNLVGIRNTHLLRLYSRLDSRVKPLVFIVKFWAKTQNIKEAKFQTISSYSWTLMVIHYLQAITQPPVVPVIMKTALADYISRLSIFDLQEDPPRPAWQSQNDLNVAELFLGFLDYYANFDYRNKGISIKHGCVRLKTDLMREANVHPNSSKNWNNLVVQEPFNLLNTASSVFDDQKFFCITDIIKRSFERLSRSLSLNPIIAEYVCGVSVYHDLAKY